MMMSGRREQGRGSAMVAAALLLLLLSHCEMARAAVYTVGGAAGWTFNVVGWPQGKRFKAGDVLLFKYNPTIHNLVVVSKAGYNTCSVPKGARTYRSGNDRIVLRKGQNFFLCSLPGHCQSGMKIAVNAA
ncbi:basic blue protein-like [Malania oleifera]|uniref:basic blue protein-like n=1 Tax=Malania oleifera TaxID=397392 RepID=UPI0025AEBCF2|nr:basic blue protein-like [Malania oleifera]